MTLLRAILACLSLGVVLGPFAAPGSAAACSGVDVGPQWTTIAAPEFPEKPDDPIAAFAIVPRRPDRIWVTNGTSLMRTDDGGCTWNEAFSLGSLPALDQPVSRLNTRIVAVEVPEAPGVQDTVHLLLDEELGPAHRPHVLSSEDAGENWTLNDPDLPLVSGAPIELAIAPSDPRVLYLLLQAHPAGGTEVWASESAGESWARRGEAPGANLMRIDPLDEEVLWFGGASLLHSTDGGRNSSPNNYAAPPVGVVDVFHASGSPSRVMAYQVEGQSFVRSDDGGRTWTPLSAPLQEMISMAHGNTSDDMIVTTHGAVHRFRPPYYWMEVTPGLIQGVEQSPEYEDLLDVQVSRTDAPHAFAHTSDTIMRYTGFSIELPPIDPSAPAKEGAAELSGPVKKKIRIPSGETADVRYRFSLPPQPTPLDVFFLMDTTKSMESSINGLLHDMHGISEDLARSKIDVWFGVGEFKDYPIPGYGDPQNGDFPYRLRRRLAPADDSLVRAIAEMEASGGGETHLPESQLTALYQSVTGEGEPPFVPPDQDAGFRPDALKVVVHITDAGFEKSQAHPSPPFDVVARELEARGVYQVGLGVWGPWGNKAAMADLEAMAKATDTRAPPGGVDCSGNGSRDIAAGEPLVCEVVDRRGDRAQLAPAIIATLRAISDVAPVDVVATSGKGLVAGIAPGYPAVDLKQEQVLPFTVTYACPEGDPISRTVRLVGTVRSMGVAGTSTEVVCRPTPKRRAGRVVPPAGVPPPAQQTSVASVLVPPAPAPVAGQIQSQPNPHAQGALAQQQERQPEVAAAPANEKEPEEEHGFAMTAYERRGRVPATGTVLLYGAALVTTLAAAAVKLRTRTSLGTLHRRG